MSVAVVGAALGGCASEFSMRRLPPEKPAAMNASAVRAAEAMEAAAKQAAAGQKPTPPGQQPGAGIPTAPTPAPAAATQGSAAATPDSTAATPDSTAATQGPTAPTPAATAPTEGAAATSTRDAAAAVASSAPSPMAEGAIPTQPVQTGPGTTTNAGGAAKPGAGQSDTDAETLVPLTAEDVPSMYTYDPWERLNRFTYRFNARFDEAIFLPVANGYRRVPGPVRFGVHNFFSNLTEVDSVANYILQARFVGSAKSLGRFVINSTIGIGGLFDVAKHMKLPSAPTGFSETLSTWGAHPGPYLVMPILGPSTLRDGVGYLGDYGLDYGVNLFNLYRGYQSYALGTLNAIDTRSNVGFRYYATGSPFEYEVIRFLYVRKRLIEDDALHGRGKPKPRDADAPAGR
jgi:phospholipid-binding lipoprotein MlaA